MSGRRRIAPPRARHVVAAWLLIYFPWLPGFPLNRVLPDVPYEFVIDANLAGQFALIAISLVVLTGWVGQISLGQGAFVGIGAFSTGLLVRHWGIPFPVSLPIVALMTAAVAALLGIVALRVRGLYLAVATLIFAWMADSYLFSSTWFVGPGGSSSIPNRPLGNPEGLTFFDFSNPRTLWLVTLALVVAVWFAAVTLRDSKTGRAFFAIRGSEMAAVSLGINVMRYKLLAFAISGAIAGIAGNLMMVELRAVTPGLFQFTESLFYLGIAVVGGITSLGGAVAAGVLFAALDELFFQVGFLDQWLDVVTIGLLLGVLLGYPGGLGAFGPAVAARLRPIFAMAAGSWRSVRAFTNRHLHGDRAPIEPEAARQPRGSRWWPPWRRTRRRRGRTVDLEEKARERLQPSAEEIAHVEARAEANDWRVADLSEFALPEPRDTRGTVLDAEAITVRFGGLTAVDNVSLRVHEHEIVGLIGPNGAGKTTTFNAIAGLNEPSEGAVRLFGGDVTREPVHVRAQIGMGRTFQLIQLFPELTVFDNLLVATHMQNSTGVFRQLALNDTAILAERRARHRVRLVVEMLGLSDLAERPVAELPFGVLRQVEIARALVTGAPFLMLDEPASGLDNAETDELAQLLRFLRSELDITILLIEHDVRMVTAVSDYMYVLNQGKLLAEGTPSEVQRNDAVVAAYLGRSAEAESEAREAELVG